MDLSTAILALAENGDLQRIHDKWLVRSSCSLDNAEIESNQLHLKSFWGVYLICGLACCLALLIYFLQIMRELCFAPPEDSISSGLPPSRSGHLKRFLSLLDEKEDVTKSGSKRRKVERSLSENDKDEELGKSAKRKQKVSFENSFR